MSEVVLRAEFSGILKLGQLEIPCFVLENKKRVISQREVVNVLSGDRKGNLDRYMNASGVRDFMPTKFLDRPLSKSTIVFTVGGATAHGYEAEDIVDICDAYLKARDAKKLALSQLHLAVQAEIFIRSCAKVGIVALIDEATGYQAVRDADDLQVKIQAYIAKELSDWTKTFPQEFFDQLYRLEGRPIPSPPKPFPLRFGKYVMNFVYDTLDPDVADWLRKNNPQPQGTKHHHQWMTRPFGHPRLERHIMSVLGIEKASTSIENCRENLARAFSNSRTKKQVKKQVPIALDQLEMTFI